MNSRVPAPQRSLAEGTTIAGYKLLGLIGAGAMGEVYEAQHHPSHRRVAIKVLREKTDDSVNAGRRLLEEARAVIAIRHPGIVVVSDVGLMTGGRPYLVMELLAGVPLSVHLKQRKLPVADIVMVLDGILDALSAAHRAGVIHRDLKPSNVFILTGDRPRVKLLDFGVARREGRKEVLTGPAMAVGSMGFMPPEQLMGQAVAASDLYAVGCIAFLLLAGRPVFPLKNIPENARSHFSEIPAKLRTLRPEVSPGLETWVDRMLGKTPGQRPPSADIALASLRALDGRDVTTQSGNKTEQVMAFVPTAPTQKQHRSGAGETGEVTARVDERSKTIIDS
ncbi:MAG: serine/threonine-protein kinase [Archangium sp.]|nr:serine/threonine-protein kinase [Archangium sp.]